MIEPDDYIAPPFDMERMKKALAGPRIMIPQGLSRDEIRAFIEGAAAAFETMEHPR